MILLQLGLVVDNIDEQQQIVVSLTEIVLLIEVVEVLDEVAVLEVWVG